MKRLLALVLIIALLSLSGCGASNKQYSIPTPAPTEEPAVTVEKGVYSDLFPVTMELDRMYLLSADGGWGVLVADNTVTDYDRRGDVLYSAFYDGSVLRTDLFTGETVTVLEAGGPGFSMVRCFDGGFLGWDYSLSSFTAYIYRESTGILEKVDALPEYISPVVTGDKIAYTKYVDDGMYLFVRDLKDMSVLWQEPISAYVSVYGFGDDLYTYDQENTVLSRLDQDTWSAVPVELQLRDTDFSLMYYWNGYALIEGNYLDNHQYIVSDSDRRMVALPEEGYYYVVEARDEQVLLYSTEYHQSDKVDGWYNAGKFCALDLVTGLLTPIQAEGKYSRMFAKGDFPVMDSSTARKPVTAQIYSFFCESTGCGGEVPLCSTTHNAWLNIADGIADIALLAAPTQGEQDYLEERGVSVDMKLYGGDGLVFIGNRACGVEDLTLDQVRAIFRGEITNWSQLGGVNHPIRVLYRDDQSGSRRLFEKLLWADMAVPDLERLGFERLDEMSTIVSECLYDPYSIGYSIMTYLNDVYGSSDLLCFSLNGVEATPGNVKAQLYPLSTRGYVVIRSDEPADSPARRLFDWFGSPLCDRILSDNGVTPLHEE